MAKEVYASQINLTIMINAKQEKALLNFSQKLSLKEDEWMGDKLVLEVPLRQAVLSIPEQLSDV